MSAQADLNEVDTKYAIKNITADNWKVCFLQKFSNVT